MAGKIHTDNEALYAVRSAIMKFAESFQQAKVDFSHCAEEMNFQIDDYLRRLRSDTEECVKEKYAVEKEIDDCAEKKAEVERKKESSRSGSTDMFVCRNEACGVSMMLKIYGDTTTCRTCGGTMHRVFTDGDYDRYNSRIYQLEQRIHQLQERSAELDGRINKQENNAERITQSYNAFQGHLDSIMELLSFDSGEDPDTVIVFIDKALAGLDDYQVVRLNIDEENTKKKIR